MNFTNDKFHNYFSELNTNLTDKLLPTSFSYATDLTDSVIEIDSLSKLSEKYQFIGIQMVQNINGDEFIYRDIAFMPLPAFCTTNFKYHIRATRSTVTEELWTDVFYVDDTHLRLTLSDGARGYVVIVRLFN